MYDIDDELIREDRELLKLIGRLKHRTLFFMEIIYYLIPSLTRRRNKTNPKTKDS